MKYIELILLDNSYYKVSIRLMLTSPYFAFHLKYTVHTLYFSDWNFGLYVTLKEKKSPMLVKQVLVLGTCYKTNLSMKVQNRTWPSTFTFNRLWKKTTPKKHMKMSIPLTKILRNIRSKKYKLFLKINTALLKKNWKGNVQRGLDPPLSQLH